MPLNRQATIIIPPARSPWQRLAALRAGFKAALRALRTTNSKR